MHRVARVSAALRASRAFSARRSFITSAIQHDLSKFSMPAMSPTMTEGGISTWKKKEGEQFAPGDVLLEIETDKATMDVEAQEDGVVAKIISGDGSKSVKVGKPIAIMAEEDDEVDEGEISKLVKEAESEPAPAPAEEKPEEPSPSAPPPEKETPKPAKEEPAPEPQEPSAPREHIFASPLARRLAQEKGIPLAEIKGTGPSGRIIKADIEEYKPAAAGAAGAAPSAAAAGGAAPYTDIPLSNMRKTIASRLTESKSGTPHYYVTSEIKIDRALQLREVFNRAAKEGAETSAASKDGVKAGVKLSINDFVMKGVSIANAEVPEANSGWHGDFIRQYSASDISMAVSTPTGLITPIISDVGSKGLATISAQSKELAAKARDGKLQPNEYQGGSFTVSNMGMFPSVSHFTAIINPPQSCILAIGSVAPKVVKDEEASAIAGEPKFKEIQVMNVTLSSDHRVVDGALSARWLNAFKAAMENPLSFIL